MSPFSANISVHNRKRVKKKNNVGIIIIIIPNYTFKWVEGLPVLLLVTEAPYVFVTINVDPKRNR